MGEVENMNELLAQDMEKFITSLSDVISSKIVLDENREIEEMHIVSYNYRKPKQISRDIQSILMAEFDYKIDYKKISVAQIQSEDKLLKDYRFSIGEVDRFSIGAIGFCMMDDSVEIKVMLKNDDKIYEAKLSGPKYKNNIYRLFVQATIDCIHDYLGRQDIFVVEDITKTNIAKQKAICIAITCLTDCNEGLLIGSAVLKKDDYEAVVKATLDAINRRVYKLIN